MTVILHSDVYHDKIMASFNTLPAQDEPLDAAQTLALHEEIICFLDTLSVSFPTEINTDSPTSHTIMSSKSSVVLTSIYHRDNCMLVQSEKTNLPHENVLKTRESFSSQPILYVVPEI